MADEHITSDPSQPAKPPENASPAQVDGVASNPPPNGLPDTRLQETLPDAPAAREPANLGSSAQTPDQHVRNQPSPTVVPEVPDLKRSIFKVVFGWALLICTFIVAANLINVGFYFVLGVDLRGVPAGILTFILFVLLDQDGWLSGLFGIQTGPNRSPIRTVLYFMTFGLLAFLFVRHRPPTAQAAATEPQTAGGTQPATLPAPPEERKDTDVFREVAETIVFVVVLVLLLKTFVAEAFVIPTGSMATTLWGYQKYVTCPECGFQFPVNCSSEMDPQNERPNMVTGCICPNCRNRIKFKVTDPRRPDNSSVDDGAVDAAGNSGDRVLVFKSLYDLNPLFSKDAPGPHRHDVVVFKYPEGPQKGHVAMNYIKRLIGLPRETIGIYFGKLYVSSQLTYPDLPSPSEPGIGEEERSRRKETLRRTANESNAKALETLKEDATRPLNDSTRMFQIVRKKPGTLLAMMRPVYDNDFQPTNKFEFPIRWAETADWKADNPALPRTFRHTEGNATLGWLRYQHILSGKSKPELITDFLGYNTNNPSDTKLSWATDLILEAEVNLQKAGGELRLEISKGSDRFQARFDLATGDCTLVRLTDGTERVLTLALESGNAPARRATALKSPGTYRLRLANVDERLTLWVNDELPFGDGVAYDPAKTPGPTVNDLEPASIGASSADLTVSHLKLWRDTYYTVHPERGDTARLGIDGLANPDQWAPLRSQDARTMYVQPGHYLCLGDNSQESSDSRYWGLVPEELLLGRALVVYFPFYCPVGPISSPTNRVGMIR